MSLRGSVQRCGSYDMWSARPANFQAFPPAAPRHWQQQLCLACQFWPSNSGRKLSASSSEACRVASWRGPGGGLGGA